MSQIVKARVWVMLLASVLCAGLLSPSICVATVTIFTDRLSWNQAVPGATTINFETPAVTSFLFVPFRLAFPRRA